MSEIEQKINPRRDVPFEDAFRDVSLAPPAERVAEITPSVGVGNQAPLELSTIDLQLSASSSLRSEALEHQALKELPAWGTEMEVRPELAQELKITQDTDQVLQIPERSFSFRGHRGGSSYLDKLVTFAADFIKKLEVRFFRWLERRRVRRMVARMMRKRAALGRQIVAPIGRGVVKKKKKKEGIRHFFQG